MKLHYNGYTPHYTDVIGPLVLFEVPYQTEEMQQRGEQMFPFTAVSILADGIEVCFQGEGAPLSCLSPEDGLRAWERLQSGAVWSLWINGREQKRRAP